MYHNLTKLDIFMSGIFWQSNAVTFLENVPVPFHYDLIALGMEPGPEIGHILNQVRNAQDTEVVTTREEALSFVKAQLYGN